MGAASRNGLHVVPVAVTRAAAISMHVPVLSQSANSARTTTSGRSRSVSNPASAHFRLDTVATVDRRYGSRTTACGVRYCMPAARAHCMTDILAVTAIGVHTVTSGAQLAYHLAAAPDRARPRP